MLSIRLRLTLYYSLILVFLLSLFGMFLYSSMSRYLIWHADRMLIEKAQAIASALVGPGGYRWHHLYFTNVFANPGFYYQFVNLSGLVIAKSQNLGSQNLPFYSSDLRTAGSGEPFFRTVASQGDKLRIYNLPLFFNGQLAGVLQVGYSLKSQEIFLERLSKVLFLSGALGLALAAALGSFLARLALAPVNGMTRVAKEISRTRDLAKRVAYKGPPDEIGSLAATFNEMLDRLASAQRSLENAHAAQQRFVADVSHELRTPLTTIRGNLELLQRLDDCSVEERNEILSDVVAEVERMSRLVQNLLTLARAEAGRHIERSVILLGEVVRETAKQAPFLGEASFEARDLDLLDNAKVLGNPDFLKQLLLILIDNAFRYTPPDGRVVLTALRREGWYGIQVRDTGSGISAADLPHIFDRFYRAGNVRRGGSGLGLAIARWIADEHEGLLEAASEEGKGSTFTFWIPGA